MPARAEFRAMFLGKSPFLTPADSSQPEPAKRYLKSRDTIMSFHPAPVLQDHPARTRRYASSDIALMGWDMFYLFAVPLDIRAFVSIFRGHLVWKASGLNAFQCYATPLVFTSCRTYNSGHIIRQKEGLQFSITTPPSAWQNEIQLPDFVSSHGVILHGFSNIVEVIW